MFNIGGGEFLVIALVALIVLGPQRLPDAARQVGRAMGELRRLSTGFQNELKDAFSESEKTPSHSPTPRRTALTAVPDPDPAPAVTAAVTSVSGQRPARRSPLRAEPLPETESRAEEPSGAPPHGDRRARVLRAAPPHPAAPPDAKGS